MLSQWKHFYWGIQIFALICVRKTDWLLSKRSKGKWFVRQITVMYILQNHKTNWNYYWLGGNNEVQKVHSYKHVWDISTLHIESLRENTLDKAKESPHHVMPSCKDSYDYHLTRISQQIDWTVLHVVQYYPWDAGRFQDACPNREGHRHPSSSKRV